VFAKEKWCEKAATQTRQTPNSSCMRMVFNYVKSLHGNLVHEKCVFLPPGIMLLMLELQNGFKQPGLCSRPEQVFRIDPF